ncbi:MAG TPA: hypothetical protein VES01_08645 [Dermatophilaceae bacterium]|nr:hypothetical protein [Dermatophilaceae bacterium]
MSCPSVSTIREDDLLLDELGRRGGAESCELGRLFNAWVRAIDADIPLAVWVPTGASPVSSPSPWPTAPSESPSSRRPVDSRSSGGSRPARALLPGGISRPVVASMNKDTTRRLRLGGPRVVAVVAIACLISGAGLVAALTGYEAPGVTQFLRSAGASSSDAPATASSIDADRVQLAAVLARCRELFVAGDVVAARSLVGDVLRRSELPGDVRADAEALEAQISTAAPIVTESRTAGADPVRADQARTPPRSVFAQVSTPAPAAPPSRTLLPESLRRPRQAPKPSSVSNTRSVVGTDRTPTPSRSTTPTTTTTTTSPTTTDNTSDPTSSAPSSTGASPPASETATPPRPATTDSDPLRSVRTSVPGSESPRSVLRR